MTESSTDIGKLSPLERVFSEALLLPQEERAAFVATQAGADGALRERVLRLLRAHTSAESLLPTPPREGLAPTGEDPDDPLIGQKLGAYQLVRLVGAGGMGAVYDATQESPRRRVAIKVLHAALIARDAAHRFRLEAEVLGALDHPGIAHVYEAGVAVITNGRIPFLAMEYVDGSTLLEHARTMALDIAARVRLFISVCEAVEHAHRKGVIHRDLKPGNIMVTALGQAKVLDFGVARLLKADAEATTIATRFGQVVGTLQYMSPEQVEGDPRGIDTRADVYSLGVVLYELLGSKRPYDFASTSVAEAAAIIKDFEPAALGNIAPECRGDLETIVRKALAKAPSERYQSAADLGADLRRYLGNEPILARPVSSLYYIRKFIVRNKGLSSSVVVVFLALLVGVVGLWIGMNRAMHATREATDAKRAESDALAASRRHELEATRSAAAAEFQSYVANLAAAAGAIDAFDIATARKHLDACPEKHRGWEWRHLSASASDSTERFEFSPEDRGRAGVWDISISRDGSRVAVVENSEQVAVWSAPTHTLVRVIRMASASGTPLTVVHGVSLNHDGTLLACANGWDNTASIWSVESGALLHRLLGHTNEVEDIEFSPDGSSLATASFDGTVGLWNTASGERTGSLVGHGGAVRTISFSDDGLRLASAISAGTSFAWDLRERRLLARVDFPSGFGGVCRISPDGKRVLSTHEGTSPWIWEADTGRTLAVLQGHRTNCEGAAWSPDGRSVATGGRDRAVRLHDAATGVLRASYRGHQSGVSNVRFFPDGLTFLTSGYGDPSGVLRWPAFEEVGAIAVTVHPGDVTSVVVSPDDRLFASIGTRWGTLSVQEVATGLIVGVVRPDSPTTCAVWIAADQLAIVCEDGSLHVWTQADGQTREIAPRGAIIYGGRLRVSPDGALVYHVPFAAGAPVRSWSLPGRTPAAADRALQALDGVIDSDGQLVLRYSTPTEVELRDLLSGEVRWRKPVTQYSGLMTQVGIAWRAGRCFLQCAAEDVALYDITTGELVSTLHGVLADGHSAALSPDGRRFAVGTRLGDAHLWSVDDAAPVFTLHSNISWIEDLAFSPDGNSLITAESSGILRVWETEARAARVADSPRRARVHREAAARFDALVARSNAVGLLPPQANADGADAEVALELARMIAAAPGTVDGTLDWSLGVLSDPAPSLAAVRRVGSQLSALSRYRTNSAHLAAMMALQSVRRASFDPAATSGRSGVSSLDAARQYLDTAMQAHERVDTQTRRFIEIVAALAARAAADEPARRAALERLSQLGPDDTDEDPRVLMLLREARD